MKIFFTKVLFLAIVLAFSNVSSAQLTSFTVFNSTTDIVQYRFYEVADPSGPLHKPHGWFAINPGQTVNWVVPNLYYTAFASSYAPFFECYFWNSGTGVPANGNSMWNWWLVAGWWSPAPWYTSIPYSFTANNNVNTGNARVNWVAQDAVVIF